MAYNVGAVVGTIRLDVQGALHNANQFKRSVGGIPAQTGVAQQGVARLSGAFVALKSNLLIATAAIYGTQRALQPLIGMINRGIGSIDEMRQRAAGMAAMMSQMFPEAPFEDVLKYTTALLPIIERMDEAFSGTGDDLMRMADMMVKFGMAAEVMKLVTDETGEAQKNFIGLAEAIKSVTAGQNIQIQMAQELRALAAGRVAPTSALMQLLAAQNAELRKQIPLWVEQGTLMENIAPYFEGFVKSSAEVSKLLSTQKSTWETIVNRILRAAFLPAYKDMVSLQEYLNSLLFDSEGVLTKMGQTVVTTLKEGWEITRLTVEGIAEILGIISDLVRGILDALGVEGVTVIQSIKIYLAVWAENLRMVREQLSIVLALQKLINKEILLAVELQRKTVDPRKWKDLGKHIREMAAEARTAFGGMQESMSGLFRTSTKFQQAIQRIFAPEEKAPVGELPELGAPRRKPEDDAAARARALEKRVTAEARAFEQLSQLHEWSIEEQIAGLQRLMERNKGYYDANIEARRTMLLKIKGLEEQARAEEEKRAADAQRLINERINAEMQAIAQKSELDEWSTERHIAGLQAMLAANADYYAEHAEEERTLQLGIKRLRDQAAAEARATMEAQHALDFSLGKLTFGQHMAWLEAQRDKYEKGNLERIHWENRIWGVQQQRQQWQLSAIDEEIAATGQGYRQKLALIDELLARQQDLNTQLALQAERRQTLNAWLQSDLSVLDDTNLSLEEQREILLQILEKWGTISQAAIPEIQSRLDEVDVEIKEHAVGWNRLFTTSAQSWSSIFETYFFDGMKKQLSSMADFWQAMLDAITRQIASMLASDIVQSFLSIFTDKKMEGKGLSVESFLGMGLLGTLLGGIGLQQGGLVTTPTLAMIGETGPEAVIPLQQGAVPVRFGEDGARPIEITVHTHIEKVTNIEDYERLSEIQADIIRKRLALAPDLP